MIPRTLTSACPLVAHSKNRGGDAGAAVEEMLDVGGEVEGDFHNIGVEL